MGSNWKELLVWQKSHELVKEVYRTLLTFPQAERFAICDQIKRAAVSIPTNIVEGHSKCSKKDFVRYLYISRGSLEEIRYLVFLSKELDFMNPIQYESLESKGKEISILLNRLIKSLED
jgi:four helix bundle protein